jgi:hypothetical protein
VLLGGYVLDRRGDLRCIIEMGKFVLPWAIFNLRGTAAFRRQGGRRGLTRAQRPSEAQSNKLCDPSMGEQNLLSKAASFRGQWFTLLHVLLDVRHEITEAFPFVVPCTLVVHIAERPFNRVGTRTVRR